MQPRRFERLIEFLLLAAAALSVFTTAGIILVLAVETIEFLREVSIVEFLTGTEWTPLFANRHFGVLPLVAGTLLVSGIAMLVALPMGLLAAVYLSEYAPDGVRRLVKPVLEVLAGVPTVVYGYFALMFVTPLLQRVFPQMSGFNALSPGIVMGIMGVFVSTVAAMSTFYRDGKQIFDTERRKLQILRLIAKTPTFAAYAYRHSIGRPYVYPDNDLSFTGNFLNMLPDSRRRRPAAPYSSGGLCPALQ